MDIIDLLNEIKVYNLGKDETELVANYLGWKKTDVSYSNKISQAVKICRESLLK